MLMKLKLLAIALAITLSIPAMRYQSTWMERQVVPFTMDGFPGCTATLMGPDGIVLTAGHCVEGKSEFSIEVDNEAQPLDLLYSDINEDFAILRLREKPHFSFIVMPVPVVEIPRNHQRVFTYGFPGWSVTLEIMPGIITGCYSSSNCAVKLMATADASPGNSGGALVTEEGDYAGVVVHRYIINKITRGGKLLTPNPIEPLPIYSGTTAMFVIQPVLDKIRRGEPVESKPRIMQSPIKKLDDADPTTKKRKARPHMPMAPSPKYARPHPRRGR